MSSHSEKRLASFLSLFSKDVHSIHEGSTLMTFNTFQMPYLITLSHWILGFKRMNFVTNTQTTAHCECMTNHLYLFLVMETMLFSNWDICYNHSSSFLFICLFKKLLVPQVCMLSRLFGTLWTITHQTPLSKGFSRQEYWSGLPCPSPVLEYIYVKISIVNTTRKFPKILI